MAKSYKDKDGYRKFTDSDKSVHRWASEKKLGRKLKPGEVVHHKDRNKENNSPDNLFVFKNQKEHDKVHKYDAYRFGPKASYKGFGNRDSKNSGCMMSVFVLIILISISFYIFI